MVKNQIGDPRFLDQVHKCIASRRALLGLDGPLRIETHDTFTVKAVMTPAERNAELSAIIEAARQRAIAANGPDWELNTPS